MTLWDKLPLTEEEIRARDVCKCGHTYADHPEGLACKRCKCGHRPKGHGAFCMYVNGSDGLVIKCGELCPKREAVAS